MLTDRNIQKTTARYWCLFCDKEKQSLQEAMMTRLANPDADIARAYRKHDAMTDAQKEAANAVFKLREEHGSELGEKMKYIVKGMDREEANAVAAQLIADLDANGETAPATMAKELGETFMYPDKVMPDGSIVTVVEPGSDLEKIAQGVNKNWMSRLWDVIKGYLSKITETVSRWFLGGEWEGASYKEKLEMILTGGLHSLELIAIAYLVYKIRGWLFPQLKLAWKNLMSGKDLARCEFNDNNGEKYLCWFDASKMQWFVKHDRGVASLVHVDDLFMTKDEADAFFATKFFTKFAKQCEKYIKPYLDVQRSQQQIQDKNTPSDVKKMLQWIVDNAKKLETNMFGMKYSYFNESKMA